MKAKKREWLGALCAVLFCILAFGSFQMEAAAMNVIAGVSGGDYRLSLSGGWEEADRLFGGTAGFGIW